MTNSCDDFHAIYAKTRPQDRLIGKDDFTYYNFFRFLLPVIERARPARILDIGSGAGTISLCLGSLGYRTVGVDISPVAVGASRDSARRLGLDEIVDFVCSDFSRLRMEIRFDLVICLEVIEHIEDDDLFLSRVRDLLHEGGLLILSAPLRTAPLARLGLTGGFDSTAGHLRRYGRDQLIGKMEHSGFITEHVKATEGIVRNSLFVFKPLHILIRCIRWRFLTRTITAIDDASGRLFGCSDLIIVGRKRK